MDYNTALSTFETKQRAANQASSSVLTLGDELKQVLNEKLANSQFVTDRSKAAEDFLTASGAAPTTVMPQNQGGVILDPAQQANLISARRASALSPLMTANQRYDLMTGSISDIIGSGTKAAQAQASMLQGEADLADKMLDKILKREELNIAKSKASSTVSKQVQEILDQAKSVKGTKGYVQQAIDLLSRAKDKGISGGIGNVGIVRGAKKSFGGLSNESVQLEYLLSQINKNIFETAGKALTGTEKQLLAGGIPEIYMNSDTLKQILQQKLTALTNEEMSLVTSMVGGGEMTDYQSDDGFVPD